MTAQPSPQDPKLSRAEQWQRLLESDAPANETGAALGLSAEQATQWREFHQASAALLTARLNQHQRARRRTQLRAVGALAAVAAIASLWAAKPAFAQIMCTQTLPAPLTTFCPDAPALSADVNANFGALASALVNKTGGLTGNDIALNSGTLGFGSSTRQFINHSSAAYGVGVQASTFYERSASNFAWYQGGVHADAQLSPGGGTTQMSLNNGGDLTVRGTVIPGGLRLKNYGDTAFAGGADVNPEVYRINPLPTNMPCDAANRGNIFVARPNAQNDQDSICYCGNQAGNYEVWCFNP